MKRTSHSTARGARRTRNRQALTLLAAPCCALLSVSVAGAQPSDSDVRVEIFDPGYLQGDSNYHSVTAASDGMIYFSVNSHHPHASVRLFRFDPADETIDLVGDVTEVLGVDPSAELPHGKIHTALTEYGGYLYFATHTSQYVGSLPNMSPTDGRRPYEGGHFMRFSLKTGQFEDLAHLGLPSEGIITMAVDTANDILYGLTWPTGLLLSYDLERGYLHNWGAIQERGEWGRLGADWNFINRKLAIDPAGKLYGSTDSGRIWRFDAGEHRPVVYLDPLSNDQIPPVQDSHFVVEPVPHFWWRNWRTILWNPNTESFWGLHGGSTQLFEFRPQEGLLRSVRTMRAKGVGNDRRNPFRTQLGFTLGPDNTLYYLAHGPEQPIEGRRSLGSSVHLITYNIDSEEFVDHGALIGPNERRVFFSESLELAPDGSMYSVAWVETIDPERMAEVQAARGLAVPEETKDAIYEMQLVRLPPLTSPSREQN